MPTNESQLVKLIVKEILAAYPDAWIFKTVGNPYQMTGVPDLLVCVRGRLIGAEVKHRRPGESHEHMMGRVSPAQWRQIGAIQAAGGIAGVVASPEEALELVARGLESCHD